MERALTRTEQKLVSKHIQKEFILKAKAERKRREGKKLSKIERRRIKRKGLQLIRIGFEKAREEDPDIPKVD